MRYFQDRAGRPLPEDDPRSASFRPLEERAPMERMRWWARRAMAKDRRQPTGQFDPPAGE